MNDDLTITNATDDVTDGELDITGSDNVSGNPLKDEELDIKDSEFDEPEGLDPDEDDTNWEARAWQKGAGDVDPEDEEEDIEALGFQVEDTNSQNYDSNL